MMDGEITVEPGWDFGANRWAIHEWNADRSTSWVVATHSSWDAAIHAAADYAAKSGRYFHSAEIVTLRPRKETLF